MPELTAYQRGHRDSLLSLATDLDREAEEALARMRAWDDHPNRLGAPVQHAVLSSTESGKAQAYRDAAQLARARSEMLPDDPEGGDDA